MNLNITLKNRDLHLQEGAMRECRIYNNNDQMSFTRW
jgi:hypothetical protein